MSKRKPFDLSQCQNLDVIKRNPSLFTGHATLETHIGPAREADHLLDAGEMAKIHAQDQYSGMNKAEKRYAQHMEKMRMKYLFEALKFRIGEKCFYTPDFYCPGRMEIYEVKAWWGVAVRVGWQPDARIKFKAAAEKFRDFTWAAVWWREDLKRFEYEWI